MCAAANDMISPKLAGLHLYQLSIPAPLPPPDSYDKEAARRGLVLFTGKARCGGCHQAGTLTDSGWNLHAPKEVCIDGFQANRAPDHRYRTAPLAGLWTHASGGFHHDGRFAMIRDVVNHYDSCFPLGLDDGEKADLVQYLKSIPANLDAAP
jgi:cytochrome c peroxidase